MSIFGPLHIPLLKTNLIGENKETVKRKTKKSKKTRLNLKISAFVFTREGRRPSKGDF